MQEKLNSKNETLRLFMIEYKTQIEISKIINLSRERVRQILYKELPEDVLKKQMKYNRDRYYKLQRKERKEKLARNKCIVCGEPRYKNKYFCGSNCIRNNPANQTPEERLEKTKEKTKKWYENIKKDPIKYKKYKDKIQKYNKKYCQRPEIVEKRRKEYNEMKKDPIKYEIHKKRLRDYFRTKGKERREKYIKEYNQRPRIKEKRNKRQNDKYANDPIYREKKIKCNKEYRARLRKCYE